MVLRALNAVTGQPVSIDQLDPSEVDRLRLETHQARYGRGQRQLSCLDCTGSLHMVRTVTLDFFRHDPGQGLSCALAFGESPEHDAVKAAIAGVARSLGWEAQVEVSGSILDPRTGRPPFIDVVAWPDVDRRDELGLAWEVQLSQAVDVAIWDRHTRRQNYQVCTWLARGYPAWAGKVPFMQLGGPPWELDRRPLDQVVRDQLLQRLVWTGQHWAERAVDADGDDDLWTELERLGRLSGHVVCRCPGCGQRQMIAYRPPSQPWPRCRVCRPVTLPVPSHGPPGTIPATQWSKVPRLVPVSDLSLVVNKNPGWPRTNRQLLAAGLIRQERIPDEATAPAVFDPGGLLHDPGRPGAARPGSPELDDETGAGRADYHDRSTGTRSHD
jgi:hypothetical protein